MKRWCFFNDSAHHTARSQRYTVRFRISLAVVRYMVMTNDHIRVGSRCERLIN